MFARRLHLFEIGDLSFCPRVIRDGITDVLQHSINTGRTYALIIPMLLDALSRTRSKRIVDLCSGGGGPWPSLFPELKERSGRNFSVLLTDKYPNTRAFERTRQILGDGVDYQTGSISAFDVPTDLGGFRTIFTGFHHFRPTDGRKIIEDAVRKNEGIAIFEFTAREVMPMLFVLFMAPIGTLLLAPFARPFRWSRILLTYVLPILPLCAGFDGFVSCLRTYSKEELQDLVDSLPANDFRWEIGEVRQRKVQPVTYLIGYPQEQDTNRV